MSEISNDTLAERLEGLKNLLIEKHEELKRQVGRVEAQTTKTNGRVTKLERWQIAIISGAAVMLFLLRDSLIDTIRTIFK